MKLLETDSPVEARFLIKILLGTLRIGVSTKSLIKVIQEIQEEFEQEYPDDKDRFGQYMIKLEKEVFGYVIRKDPKFLVPNTPVTCMLGRAAKNFSDLDKLVLKSKKIKDKRVLAEFKYDGERCQFHFSNNTVKLFSRGFEIQNFKFSELVNALEYHLGKQKLPFTECILDGEVVFKNDFGDLLPFQEIEKKTTNKIELKGKYPCLYIFDVLMYNGMSLINDPILDRKEVLEDPFSKIKCRNLHIGTSVLVDLAQKGAEKKIDDLMAKSLKEN